MATETGSTTVIFTPSNAGLRGAGKEQAILVLAYGDDGQRRPERVLLPKSDLELGRDTPFFPGGPLFDASVSRKHAAFRKLGPGWMLDDLGSRNGVFVNGERLTGPHALQVGDVIRIGTTLLIFAVEPKIAEPAHAGRLVGASGAMSAVHRRVDQAAPYDHTVLITGETGTGKEVVAREIHERSGRKGEFIAVNCGAFSEGVLESELFGHVKGAFTGAIAASEGLFRAADNGTIFLDEVGEMPAELQVKLLRALENRAVRPVGGTREFPTSARVVAATNRNLMSQIREGAFRADLYARLAQWPIHLPTMRERRDDIPYLVQALLERLGASGRAMTLELAEALFVEPWPLNVRGLLNALTIASVSSPAGEPLGLTQEVRAALDAQRELAEASEPRAEQDAAHPSRHSSSFPPPTDELREVLRQEEGNLTRAARRLGCSRQQLYRLISARELDLDDLRGGAED